jgi:hypothetical protein
MTWHTDLSPAAARAQREGDARRRIYARSLRCTLARNATRAIIMRPANRNREHQLAAYEWIKANLPAFEYDAARGWWVGPLEALPDAWKKLKEFDMVALSDGAQRYLEEVGYYGRESDS